MKKPITQDAGKIARVYELSAEGLSATKIARHTRNEKNPITVSEVESLWRAFSGRNSFLDEIEYRKSNQLPLIVEKVADAKELLSPEELVNLAGKLMRRKTWRTALDEIGRVELDVGKAQRFAARIYGGSIDEFFRVVGPLVHAKQQHAV